MEIDTTTREHQESGLNVTEDDLLEAKEIASNYTLEEVRGIMKNVYTSHRRDPNFPVKVLSKIEDFLGSKSVFEDPDKHRELIGETKLEAALIANNSPYAEVRSVVDNHDDPTMPCSTIRAWVIGVFFSCCVAFINGFFEIRQPPIAVGANVPQLLAYPVGKLMEKVLPDVGLTLFGVRHSLNPGPFNRKEHMLITIMSNVAKKTPYTNYIFWIQYLPQYFNQSWAISFGYKILVTISTNFIGYGLAGLCRRFLVYPAYCLWPTSLVTIALNTAFHGQGNPEAAGPFGKIWRWSRLKVFMVSFLGMFSYFWLPSSLFMALSSFSWMTWISPNDVDLNIITGSETGLGVNLLPTFDWNRMTNWVDPLMIPFFTTGNLFMGAFMSAFIILAMYYSNAFGMAHLPINANVPFDNMGLPYNVSAVIDERGIRDEARYQAYSMPYSTAGHLMLNMAFFASYPAALLYAVLYHRRVLMMGFRDLFNSMWSSKKRREHEAPIVDVHIRLMSQYNEVPEWWYLICLSVAAVMGLVAVACWPTNTTPAVVFFGVALALVFVVPIGIVMAMTGIELPLHVLSQFLGGSWVDGNALALCFFKSYGYLTCSHALHFSSDLKVAHYLKIPPRMTFCSQMVPTLVSTLVCVGILQYQIHLDNICTREAAFRFYCPTVNTFFTQAVLWGTVGPKKLWGAGGPYSLTLLAFPIGAAITVLFWTLGRRYPRSRFLHNTHPVILIMGGVLWAPFNLTYIWPAVPVAAASWLWIKVRYVALWSKYNFVLSAAFAAGIAILALVQFFALSYNGITLKWWGNTVIAQGCEGIPGGCVKQPITDPSQYFGPDPGNLK